MKDSVFFDFYTTIETPTAEETSRFNDLIELNNVFYTAMANMQDTCFEADTFGSEDTDENFVKFLDEYDGNIDRITDLMVEYLDNREREEREYEEEVKYQMAI